MIEAVINHGPADFLIACSILGAGGTMIVLLLRGV